MDNSSAFQTTAQLFSCDRKVSRLGLGTWPLGGPFQFGGKPIGWGAVDPREALRTLTAAKERGINFFDTADIYGGGVAEELLGEVFGDNPDVVICTKFGNVESQTGEAATDFSATHAANSIDRALRRLKRSTIDILLLHSPPAGYLPSDELRAALEQAQKQGKIKAFGVSAKTIASAKAIVASGFGTAIEAIYNVLDRRAEEDLLPLCAAKNIDFFARVPLASGFLSTKPRGAFPQDDFRSAVPPEDLAFRKDAVKKLEFLNSEPGGLHSSALRFCLSHPAVSVVIAGMRSVEQVKANTEALSRGKLSNEVLMQVAEAIPDIFVGWR